MRAAWRMVFQSDWLPMMMPTGLARFIFPAPDAGSAHYRNAKPPGKRGGLRDNVRQQLAFEARQQILERQFAALQPLHLDRIERAAFLETANVLVERPVLGLELRDLGLDRFDLEVHRRSETLLRKDDLV